MSDKATKDNEVVKDKVENLYENLRVLPLETIDSMLKYVYNSNKESFDLYFNLLKAKETNKIQTKSIESNALAENAKDDKLKD